MSASASPRPHQLITVEDSFRITGQGLVLSPYFNVPASGFKGFEALVTVKRPNGESFEYPARFQLTRFSSEDGSSKWVIQIALAELTRDDVPNGSAIYVDDATVAKLNPHS